MQRFFLQANNRKLVLQVGDTIIGRSRNCNLVLKDPSVSRNHALLIVGTDTVTLKDLNSTNGTYVNDQRLTAEVTLVPGDRIAIGQAELLLGLTEQPMVTDPGSGIVPPPGSDLEPTSTKPTLEVSGEELQVSDGVPHGSQSHEKVTVSPPVPLREKSTMRSESPAAAVRAIRAEPQAASGEIGPSSPARSVLDDLARQPTAEPVEGGELLPSLDELDDLEDLAGAAPFPAPVRVGPPAAPMAVVASSVRQPDLPVAGFWLRCAAALVDGVVISAVALAVSLIGGGPGEEGGRFLGSAAFFALSVLVPVFGWSIWGTTPGKRLFRLYVRELGGRGDLGIGVGKAILRYLGYFASAVALGGGFLMIAFNQGKRGLHDVIAGTYVGRRS